MAAIDASQAVPNNGGGDSESREFESRVFAGDGSVRLHAFVAGERPHPAVVLLHGFPDFSLTWRRQMWPLANKEFYVVALDLRGAGRSSTPREPEDYHLDRHVADLTAVIGALQPESRTVHVVAHDFGAHVAWLAAMRGKLPRDGRLAVINGVHPAHARTVGASPSRLLALSHVGLLLPHGLAETLLTPEILLEVLIGHIREGMFDAEDAKAYLKNFRRPHVRHAMFQWYRQLARAVVRKPRLAPKVVEGVHVLTLYGKTDPFLDRALVEPPPSWVQPPENVKNRQCKGGHWLHWDYPDECTKELLKHLRPPA